MLLRYKQRTEWEVNNFWWVNIWKVVGLWGVKVVSFGCGPWRWYRGVGEIHMNRGRAGEERGGEEMGRCPLTFCYTMLDSPAHQEHRQREIQVNELRNSPHHKQYLMS
jgi:hypothetical protein